MPKLYIYKMTTDNGGAPCVRDKKLSLAICMPIVRTSAEKGDIVLGFAGNSLYCDNPLVFAAEITNKVCGKAYYADGKYTERPDSIYEYQDGKYSWRADARYHSSNDLTQDLGAPQDYERAKVLLSEGCSQFRYFGPSCPIPYKSKYQHLAEFVRNLGRGYRVNLKDPVRNEMLTFLDDIWKTRETPANTDVPKTHCSTRCGEEEDECECKC